MVKSLGERLQNVWSSDGAEVVISFVELGLEEGPIISLPVKTLKFLKSSSEIRLYKKIEAAFTEITRNITDENRVLLATAIDNIKRECPDSNYFNEAIYNALEKADSSYRSKLIGRLIKRAAEHPDIQTEFWEILNVIQTLSVKDLEKIPRAYAASEYLSRETKISSLKADDGTTPKHYDEIIATFGEASLQRMGSLGLSDQIGDSLLIISKFAATVVKAIE